MRIPRKGQKGFTLIELLIVVAILGVLAAVIIPNVQRFIGAGEEEAADTEFSNVQTAVTAMMVDNQLSTLPNPIILEANRTNDMGAFPDTSVCAADKMYDPDGVAYVAASDKDGYLLYQHDIKAGDAQAELVNYVVQPLTAYWYWVDATGTVSQSTTAP